MIKKTETFSKWLRKLSDRRAKALIVARIERVGSGLMGDVQSVGDGISELRIHYGPGYRLYFCRRGEEIIILLCGGDKSTQQADIERAKKIAQEV